MIPFYNSSDIFIYLGSIHLVVLQLFLGQLVIIRSCFNRLIVTRFRGQVEMF